MKKVQGNDSFQRINYLYQISKYMAGNIPALSSYYGNLIVNVAKKNVLKIPRQRWADDIVRAVGRNWQHLSLMSGKNGRRPMPKKGHPDIKRQICKKCRGMLVHNVSAKMKLKSKNKAKVIQWLCRTCQARKSYPADKNIDHRLWLEKTEAVVEVVN